MTTQPSPLAAFSQARQLADLTIRLHDGPLYSMAALYREAAALALASEGGGTFDVARLAQLAQIAQGTLARFQAFTGDLHKLVGDITAQRAGPRAVTGQPGGAARNVRNVIE